MKIFLISTGIILFALFLFFARLGAYETFHKAEINGSIDTIYRYRDYVMITVKQAEFRIIPVPLNSVTQLDRIAAPGDSVFKTANNDTLTLIRNDKIFQYTVKKY